MKDEIRKTMIGVIGEAEQNTADYSRQFIMVMMLGGQRAAAAMKRVIESSEIDRKDLGKVWGSDLDDDEKYFRYIRLLSLEYGIAGLANSFASSVVEGMAKDE